MFLFIFPLVILVIGYGLGLWFAFTGRRLVRRFFLLPLFASLIVTAIYSSRFEQRKPSRAFPSLPDDKAEFLPLYALRIAPLTLGVCLIANAAGYLTMTAVHRRFHKQAAATEPAPDFAGGADLEPE